MDKVEKRFAPLGLVCVLDNMDGHPLFQMCDATGDPFTLEVVYQRLGSSFIGEAADFHASVLRPGSETAIQAVDLIESLMLQIFRCALAADAMITADNQGLIHIGVPEIVGQIVIAEADGSWNMGRLKTGRIANIDYLQLGIFGHHLLELNDRKVLVTGHTLPVKEVMLVNSVHQALHEYSALFEDQSQLRMTLPD